MPSVKTTAMRLLCVLQALAAGGVLAASDSVQFDLKPQRHNGGAIARAILTPQAQGSGLNVFVSEAPLGATAPLHLYAFIYDGSCGQPGAQPLHEMNREVTAEREAVQGWRFRRQVPAPLEALHGKLLLIRSSPADGNQSLFCGVIP
jgi:hypothetical protein